MKDENNFSHVMDRCKKFLKIKNDCDVAKALGMSASTFNERKKRDSIPYSDLIKLADSENVDLNWLLSGEGTMYRDAVKEEIQLDTEERAVLRIMKKMDQTQKTIIRANAESIEQVIDLKQQVSALTMRQSA